MPLIRKQHWETRAFNDFLLARAHAPFVWGGNDCALFAADGIQAITDVDIAADFRGLYHDEKSAWAMIKQVCNGTTVEDAAVYCANKHELVEWKYPLMAKRGDLVVLEESERIIAGLVHLSGRHVVVVGEGGLKRLPITQIKRAWAL